MQYKEIQIFRLFFFHGPSSPRKNESAPDKFCRKKNDAILRNNYRTVKINVSWFDFFCDTSDKSVSIIGK